MRSGLLLTEEILEQGLRGEICLQDQFVADLLINRVLLIGQRHNQNLAAKVTKQSWKEMFGGILGSCPLAFSVHSHDRRLRAYVRLRSVGSNHNCGIGISPGLTGKKQEIERIEGQTRARTAGQNSRSGRKDRTEDQTRRRVGRSRQVSRIRRLPSIG